MKKFNNSKVYMVISERQNEYDIPYGWTKSLAFGNNANENNGVLYGENIDKENGSLIKYW